MRARAKSLNWQANSIRRRPLTHTTKITNMPRQDYSKNNAKIAKNTLLLYVRMFFLIFLGFFTVRKLLEVLGVEDFGLVNLITSIVMIFSFLSGILSTAASRFFNFELGKNDPERLKKLFSAIVSITFFCGAIIFLLAITAGYYYFLNYVDIPEAKRDSVSILYILCAAAFVVRFFALPYEALVISHEDMSIFSWVTIIEYLLRLCVVYALFFLPDSRIVYYGVMMILPSAFVLVSTFVVCKLKYAEAKYKFVFERQMLAEILSFMGWSVFGNVVYLVYNALVNVILNNVLGGGINAARALSVQVSTAVSSFANNFLAATRPQLVQNWATQDKNRSRALTLLSAKYAYFMVLVFVLPLELETNFVIGVWLDKIPEYTIMLTRIILVCSLVEVLSYPPLTLIQAVGKIAAYQITVSAILFINAPAVYVILKLGGGVGLAMSSAIAIAMVATLARLVFLQRLSDIKIAEFFKAVVYPAGMVTAVSIPLPLAVFAAMPEGVVRFICVVPLSVACVILGALYLGMGKAESDCVKNLIVKKVKSLFKYGSNNMPK